MFDHNMLSAATGTSLLAHVDRLAAEDLDKMVAALSGHAAHHARLQLNIVGGFQDNKNVSQSLLIPVLGRGKHRLHVCHTHTAIAATIQKNPNYFELRQLCVGEAVTTVNREGVAVPLVSGLGLSLRTGEIFPAVFSDRGPDMDLRLARTLTPGEKVGMLEVYDCVHEEMVIGPFTYR